MYFICSHAGKPPHRVHGMHVVRAPNSARACLAGAWDWARGAVLLFLHSTRTTRRRVSNCVVIPAATPSIRQSRAAQSSSYWRLARIHLVKVGRRHSTENSIFNFNITSETPQRLTTAILRIQVQPITRQLI
jgi:hypothetical protein